MARLTNNEVVSAFLAHRNAESFTGALTSVYDRLYSYGTCIAQFDGDGNLYLNRNKYSMTTSSKHQSPLFRMAHTAHYNIINVTQRVPRGTYDLIGIN